MLCVPVLRLATGIVTVPLVKAPVATMALPLLASSRLTSSPLGTPPVTATVKVTNWPAVDGFGPLSVSVVVVTALTSWLTLLDWLAARVVSPP